MAENYRIDQNEKFNLKKFDPQDTSWWQKDKARRQKRTKKTARKTDRSAAAALFRR